MERPQEIPGIAPGPLRAHPANGRYFADPAGRAVYLAGSHTWANWVEMKVCAGEPDFDYGAYLDFMVAHNHNFMRLWGWEHARWATWDGTGRHFIYPLAYARTGPGAALDGLPKFDLSRFDPAYFQRLRGRVTAAEWRGIYAAVKLFDGFSVGFKGAKPDARWVPTRNPYRGHPFHAENNISGIDGDPGRTGQGKDVQTLRIPAITRLQEAFVRKVVDTVNDLDNVLYEICNESDGTPETVQWQYHFIRFLKEYQAGKPKQHPVGMTVPYPWGDNRVLWEGPADWVSPNGGEDGLYRTSPPPADGKKVIVSDTDHIWGHGAEVPWVWKSFCRGLNLLLMDPWEPIKGGDLFTNNFREHPTWEPVRRSMGCARAFADRMDLASMVPAGELASSGYCLACPGKEYFVYQPESGPVEVDLSAGPGPFRPQWFDPSTGRSPDAAEVPGGARRLFRPPFPGEVILHMRHVQT